MSKQLASSIPDYRPSGSPRTSLSTVVNNQLAEVKALARGPAGTRPGLAPYYPAYNVEFADLLSNTAAINNLKNSEPGQTAVALCTAHHRLAEALEGNVSQTQSIVMSLIEFSQQVSKLKAAFSSTPAPSSAGSSGTAGASAATPAGGQGATAAEAGSSVDQVIPAECTFQRS